MHSSPAESVVSIERANLAAVVEAWSRPGTCIYWRTLAPATIEGDDIPIEELRFYREKLDELMAQAAGRYVLIAGRKIIDYFPDLESVAAQAQQDLAGQSFLIKRVSWIQPYSRSAE